MKNNFEERFEQIKNNSSKDVAPTLAESNLLNFPNSTQSVELPSKGKFYPEGHPLKNKEYVEIKEMTAREEDILTNKSYIKKGILIDKLIDSLLVDKSIPVNTLLVGDKNAIMVAARINAYGANYDVSVNCTECNQKNILSIDLQEIKVRQSFESIGNFADSDMNEIYQSDNGNIVVKLPRTKWLVETKLMNGEDERRILNILEAKKNKNQLAELTISEQLKIIIASINNITDTAILFEAVDAMPAYDAKQLRTVYQKLIPNVVIEKKYICSSCTEEQELEVPFTQEFFWPK